MFQEADCLLITKMDLAPHLDVDVNRIVANVRQMNPDCTIISVSAKTGEGLEAWFEWLRAVCDRSSVSEQHLSAIH
jgi:hydrogenase nickel incorporation protein HypB